MKRINRETGKPFKKGDIDENGRVFWNYITGRPLNKSGYFKENWCSSKEQFEKQKHVSLIYTIKNQKENKERYTQYRADRYASLEGRSKMLIASAKKRAKVSITPAWVENKINSGFCEISGLPFDLSPTNKFFKNPYSPSLDKIDPNIKEYSEFNTRVVLACVNDALNQYGLEHFLKVAEAVICKQKEK